MSQLTDWWNLGGRDKKPIELKERVVKVKIKIPDEDGWNPRLGTKSESWAGSTPTPLSRCMISLLWSDGSTAESAAADERRFTGK